MPRRTSNTKTTILLLVHPGSACGSANMTLGRYDARAARDFLTRDIAAWKGPFFVIDGTLSDEIPDYPALDSAIKSALKQAGGLGGRIWGCDDAPPHLTETLPTLLASLPQVTPKSHRFELTGCWTSHGRGTGCVDAAAEVLALRGFDADIRDSAIVDPSHEQEDDA